MSALAVRSLLRWLWHLPDRPLHPLRRRAALRRMALRGPGLVVFVCHGNICRSPFAAGLVRLRRPDLAVLSAGFIGPGRPAPPQACEAALKWDVDLSSHRSRQVDLELVRGASLIVVMDAAQGREVRWLYGVAPSRLELLGDFDPQPIRRRAIPDPVDRPLQEFLGCYARIERCVAAMLEAWHPHSARGS